MIGKFQKLILIIAAMFTFLFGCQTAPKNEGIAKNANWHESMSVMSESLVQLMALSGDPLLAEDKIKIAKFKKALSDLSLGAHRLDQVRETPSEDPALVFVSRDFKKDLEKVEQDLIENRFDQARHGATSVTRYCVACHTLNKTYALSEKQLVDDSFLSESQRGDLWASLRQFDRAVIHYENALTDSKWGQNKPDAWNESFLKLLSITVRVKQQPGLTMELISRFLDVDSYPRQLKPLAKHWRKQTKEWRSEKKIPATDLKFARKLIQVGSDQELKLKKSGLIHFLRASSSLHRFLKDRRQSRNSEAFYLAGIVAENLEQLNLWTFPRDYFNACVRAKEDSPWKSKCEAQLKKIEEKEI